MAMVIIVMVMLVASRRPLLNRYEDRPETMPANDVMETGHLCHPQTWENV